MTLKAGHTAGPWEFDGRCQIVEAARPHMRVAFLPSDHAEYASSEANGRLIAAAPELLEVLREITTFLRGTNTLATRGAEIEISRLCRNSEAALAKAEGGT